MRWIVAGLLAVHGLIHLMGFAKAFGYAELPQLMQPVSVRRALSGWWAGLLNRKIGRITRARTSLTFDDACAVKCAEIRRSAKKSPGVFTIALSCWPT